MKYLTTKAMIKCCHGGTITPKSLGQSSLIINDNPVLCEDDIVGADIFGCKQISPSTTPCQKVHKILSGVVNGVSVDGKKPLLKESFIALTDGTPPGICLAVSDGNSVMETNISVNPDRAVTSPVKPFSPDEKKKGYITIKIHADNGYPLAGAWYLLTHPDGSSYDGLLDQNGSVTVKGIDEGSCKITFLTIDIIHTLKSGETLPNVAKAYYDDEDDSIIRNHQRNQNIQNETKIYIPAPVSFGEFKTGQEHAIKVELPQSYVDLQYKRADGEAITNAIYVIKDVRGSFSKEGVLKTDEFGVCRVDGLVGLGPFEVYFHDDKDEFEVTRTISDTKTIDVLDPDKNMIQETWDWVLGTIQGDFNEEQTTGQLVVNTVLGLVPFVDQFLDFRDLTAGIRKLTWYYTSEQKTNNKKEFLGLSSESWLWINIFIIAIGCIPFLGSLIKGMLKGTISSLKKMALPAIENLTDSQARQLWEKALSILNYFGKGNAHNKLKSIKESLPGVMKNAGDILKKPLDGIYKMALQIEQRANGNRKIITYASNIKRMHAKLGQAQKDVEKWIQTLIEKILQGKHYKVKQVKGNSSAVIKQKSKKGPKRVQKNTPPQRWNTHAGTPPHKQSCEELSRKMPKTPVGNRPLYDYFHYRTDEYEIKAAYGWLGLYDGKRNLKAQRDMSRGTGDHASHLFAKRFGGTGESINLSAQNWMINTKSYAKMEKDWADYLKEGEQVFVKVIDRTKVGEKRSQGRIVEWIIIRKNGKMESDKLYFINPHSPKSREAQGIKSEKANIDTDIIDVNSHPNYRWHGPPSK